MKLDYTFHEERKFPHWVEQFQNIKNSGRLDINDQMNINDWCGHQFGELGVKWGFYYEFPKPGEDIFNTEYLYSWRFQNEDDAMLFKLTWG